MNGCKQNRTKSFLWFSNQRYFMLPENHEIPAGESRIQSETGKQERADLDKLVSFEIPEAEALRWAKHELGESLDELKHVIDDKLADWQQKLDEFKQA
jgi:hypothetical protein